MLHDFIIWVSTVVRRSNFHLFIKDLSEIDYSSSDAVHSLASKYSIANSSIFKGYTSKSDHYANMYRAGFTAGVTGGLSVGSWGEQGGITYSRGHVMGKKYRSQGYINIFSPSVTTKGPAKFSNSFYKQYNPFEIYRF